MKVFLTIVVIIFILPPVVYFCMKFGTVGYNKGKQFIEEEKKNHKCDKQ